MRSNILKAVVIFAACFALLAMAGRVLAQNLLPSSFGLGGESIALITVEGVITAGSAPPSFLASEGVASSLAICDQLYSVAEDTTVRGVLLRVNSPGGSAVGSDEIFRAIQHVKQAGKPVVVSMGDMAASGGYYISAPASFIYANGATFTGSIGVIFSMLNWERLAEKVGLDEITLTAGEHKDIGNPWRAMSDEERAMLKGMLNDVHTQFIAAVDEGRGNLDAAQVTALATGMVFTGQQALSKGLVDAIGGQHEAEAKVRELAGVGSDVPVVEYGGTSLLDELFALRSPLPLPKTLQGLLSREPLTLLSRGLYLNTLVQDLAVR